MEKYPGVRIKKKIIYITKHLLCYNKTVCILDINCIVVGDNSEVENKTSQYYNSTTPLES